jgi:hypothetical protein
MNKWVELLLGLILLLGTILFVWFSPNLGAFWDFKNAAWVFLKGGLAWFIALVGLIFILVGINDLKG